MFFGKKINKKIYIEGLKCGGCVKRVENVLSTFKEVKEYNVSLEEKCATITLKKDIDDQILIDTINNLGFTVTKVE